MSATNGEDKLDRTLGPLMLWGLGVGYVISGMYFGWNLGLPEGGTLGLGIATFFPFGVLHDGIGGVLHLLGARRSIKPLNLFDRIAGCPN